MSLVFWIRDKVRPPELVLQELDLRSGMRVVDYGCGPGAFSIAAARLVGPEGCVYAVDIHPLAVQSVQRAAGKRGFGNLATILGGDLDPLPSHSIDVVLCYDVLHLIARPSEAWKQMRRVLKPDGVLSVSDHHLKDEDLVARATLGGAFSLVTRGRRTFQFKAAQGSAVRE